MNYTFADVLKHFYPNSQYNLIVVDDYTTLQWNSSEIEKPSQEHLESLKSELDYLITRQMLYPSIPEQLDMLWHDLNQNLQAQAMFPKFYNAIKTIKDAVPKSQVPIVVINYPRNNEI